MSLMLRIGLSVLALGSPVAAFADVIYLKNGDVIEGNILNVTDAWTTIKSGIKIYKYDAARIERIEKDDTEVPMNPQDEELTEKKRDLIKGFLAANGVRKMIDNNIQSALAKMSADQQAEYKGFFNADVLIDLLVPIYAEQFTTKDLEKLVNFFDSPTGKRFVETSPAILEETFKVIVDYFKSKSAL